MTLLRTAVWSWRATKRPSAMITSTSATVRCSAQQSSGADAAWRESGVGNEGSGTLVGVLTCQGIGGWKRSLLLGGNYLAIGVLFIAGNDFTCNAQPNAILRACNDVLAGLYATGVSGNTCLYMILRNILCAYGATVPECMSSWGHQCGFRTVFPVPALHLK